MKRFFNLTGYPASDFINNQRRSLIDLCEPTEIETSNAVIQQALDEKRPYIFGVLDLPC